MNADVWLKIGIMFIMIPFIILFVQYVIRTEWEITHTGRALAWLIITGLIQSIIALAGTWFPHLEWLIYFRTGIRVFIGLGLWNLVFVMQRARTEVKRLAKDEDNAPTPR